ncbi:MAG: tetratricopeptide repeat protein [Desulfobacterales bacterium]|nr:tetratricopeptide repeat protein [Desulfobacterales bacterium]
MDDDSIKDAMLSYVSFSNQPAAHSWDNLMNNAKALKDYAMFKRAAISPKPHAIAIYENIYKYYPKGKFASEALWEVFWNEYSNGNYQNAALLGKKHGQMFINTLASPKILFWTAKAYEKLGQRNSASNYYNELLSKYPDSYYAFRADGRLGYLHNGVDKGWRTNPASKMH